MLKHLPNTLTAANLFFGCLAIVSIFDANLTGAAWLIGAAAVCDFFDGFAARLLKVQGELGKQLDSLADVVSFGVAPGFIFYSISQENLEFSNDFVQWLPLILAASYIPYLIPVFSAFRLAKFNLDTRQSDQFIGLPTPANALFICSIPFALESGPGFAQEILTSNIFLVLYPVVAAWLMMSEIPMLALKFKSFAWNPNKMRYLLLLICGMLVVFFHAFGVGLSILVYVLLSLLQPLVQKT